MRGYWGQCSLMVVYFDAKFLRPIRLDWIEIVSKVFSQTHSAVHECMCLVSIRIDPKSSSSNLLLHVLGEWDRRIGVSKSRYEMNHFKALTFIRYRHYIIIIIVMTDYEN